MTMLLATGLGAFAGSGCASFSETTRKDISARMAGIQEGLGGCYEAALQRNRKLQGTMVVAFTAREKTGQFSDVRLKRNDLPDPDLERCVTEKVATLKLEKPTETKLAVDYPVEFSTFE